MVFLSCKEYMAFKKELLILVTINDSSVTHLAYQIYTCIFYSKCYNTFRGGSSGSYKIFQR